MLREAPFNDDSCFLLRAVVDEKHAGISMMLPGEKFNQESMGTR